MDLANILSSSPTMAPSSLNNGSTSTNSSGMISTASIGANAPLPPGQGPTLPVPFPNRRLPMIHGVVGNREWTLSRPVVPTAPVQQPREVRPRTIHAGPSASGNHRVSRSPAWETFFYNRPAESYRSPYSSDPPRPRRAVAPNPDSAFRPDRPRFTQWAHLNAEAERGVSMLESEFSPRRDTDLANILNDDSNVQGNNYAVANRVQLPSAPLNIGLNSIVEGAYSKKDRSAFFPKGDLWAPRLAPQGGRSGPPRRRLQRGPPSSGVWAEVPHARPFGTKRASEEIAEDHKDSSPSSAGSVGPERHDIKRQRRYQSSSEDSDSESTCAASCLMKSAESDAASCLIKLEESEPEMNRYTAFDCQADRRRQLAELDEESERLIEGGRIDLEAWRW